MLCILCKSLVPPNRRKYCSTLCIKRLWNIRHLKLKESIGLDNRPKGIAWEEWFIKKFGAKRPQRALNTPFDFFWGGDKIDLKVCELYKRKRRRGKLVKKANGVWAFNRNGDDADFMLCIGLIKDKIVRVFKIPNVNFPKTGATIGVKKSKYDKYLITL